MIRAFPATLGKRFSFDRTVLQNENIHFAQCFRIETRFVQRELFALSFCVFPKSLGTREGSHIYIFISMYFTI